MADNYISQILTPSGDSYDIKSKITSAIPYGEVDSTSTATEFTATVPGINALYDGVCMLLRNGRVASASGFTININNLGAKPVYSNLASGEEVTPKEATRDTTIFGLTYTMLFVYSTTLVDGGCWICYRGYDANTNTIGYQVRTNSGNLLASDTGYRYRLWFTSADGKKWVPANTSTSTDATTSRTMNTRPINPFGPIVYNSTNGAVNSGARPAVTTLWQQYTLTIGYSYVLSLTAWDPVYVQCTPQTDGSAIMNAIVKALPTSKDGKIYIYLGMAYSTTAMELRLEHPVFYHDGNGIRVWTGKNTSEVVVTPTLTSGTKVGDIVVDGSTKTFYAPTPTSITTSAALTSGTKIGTVNATTFYAPTPPTSVSQLTNDSGFTTNTGTITKVKTTAGAHSTVDVSSGAVNFNIPTKTSHLTNDSGFTTNTGTITGVKTVAGAHSTVNVTSGTANFNIPTKTSHLTNDSGFITGYTETDPTVPSWAKASTKPSYNFSLIGSKPNTISGYGITNAYTKTEVDGLISGVFHYKGTKAAVSNLPTSGNTIGDVWHITADGSERAWDGSEWQELGSNIDLSAYITGISKTTATIGSASVTSNVAVDDITSWTTNTPTQVNFNTVVTNCTTGSITIPSSTTVVTSVSPATVVTKATMPTAVYNNGILTFTSGGTTTGPSATVGTGPSVNTGNTVAVVTTFSKGVAGSATAGTAAALSYTSTSIPNISVTNKTVVTNVSAEH